MARSLHWCKVSILATLTADTTRRLTALNIWAMVVKTSPGIQMTLNGSVVTKKVLPFLENQSSR